MSSHIFSHGLSPFGGGNATYFSSKFNSNSDSTSDSNPDSNSDSNSNSNSNSNYNYNYDSAVHFNHNPTHLHALIPIMQDFHDRLTRLEMNASSTASSTGSILLKTQTWDSDALNRVEEKFGGLENSSAMSEFRFYLHGRFGIQSQRGDIFTCRSLHQTIWQRMYNGPDYDFTFTYGNDYIVIRSVKDGLSARFDKT
jgi:hypothetical protein